MPLTSLQSRVLRILAAGRSLDSYIAGGIDIFQDSEQRLEAAVAIDARALADAGLAVSWKRIVDRKTRRQRSQMQMIGCASNGFTTAPFAFSLLNWTICLDMYCIQ